MRIAALVAACLGCWAGCARDVTARLPTPAGEPTGTVTVLLTRPAGDLTISVNGVLVAERAHTDRVHVVGVPTGMADIVIAAGAGEARVERHVQVAVQPGLDTAIPLAAPAESMSKTVALTVLSAAVWLLGRAAYLAWL